MHNWGHNHTRNAFCLKEDIAGYVSLFEIDLYRVHNTMNRRPAHTVSLLTAKSAFFLGILLSCALCVASANAQGTLLARHVESSVSLEYSKPFYEPGRPSITAGSSVWFLSTRVASSDQVYVLAELPLVFTKQNYTSVYSVEGVNTVFTPASETLVGNPFIGAQITPTGSPLYALFGVRLPLAKDDREVAEAYGKAGDFDRFDAFSPRFTSLRMRLGLSREFQSNTEYHFWLGTILMVGDRINNHKPFYIDYGAQLRFLNRSFRAIIGISGKMLYSGKVPDFQDRLVHQFGAAANFGSGWIRPGVHFRTPLTDKLGVKYLNYVVGLDLTIRLGPAY